MKRLLILLLAFVCLASSACSDVPQTDGTSGDITTDAPVITPDTTEGVPDTTDKAPDTTVPSTDTTAPATDTTVPAPDTTVPAPDTTVPAPDTTVPSTTEPIPPVDVPDAVIDNDIVIYENTFSNSDLSDFEMRGTMQVSNGVLKAVGASTASAYISYKLPDEYKGLDYLVEVDCTGFNNMGGILIGATKPNLSRVPSQFSGYVCTTAANGKTTQIMYFDYDGLGDKFAPASTPVPDGSCHMSVKVYKGALTYRITSLDGKTLYQEFRYEPGDHEKDIYNTITSTTGLFMSCGNSGSFDNFKVTVIKDDVIP
ncbi:MAG: hypothetical protein IJF74_05520, partial [Clostridia bacterium]|nr:hypothetical protein [Clostridia bacterium]